MKTTGSDNYDRFVGEIAALLETARRQAMRSVNAVLTATYWEIGRRIVEYEQIGKERAPYGEELLKQLSKDLSKRFGKGFGPTNLKLMRKFFLTYKEVEKSQTASDLLLEPICI